ncbi:fad-binding domain-containing protein [Diplodia corticola]|uniref:Fad-binding domain-containing protein n=1 Tax=Diplodia corticola TaxID=236234 RepID=A0A1J9SM77_9PEZI|nr:fad-binding domain-containing protein [Diplodia corticola]OJD40717.1 fad-binding domain-containing protein [Diplodia corticola]
MANNAFLTDEEITQFLDQLDRYRDGKIDYRELQHRLDQAHNDITPDPQPDNIYHDAKERHRFLRSIVGTDEDHIPRAELAQRIREWEIPSLEQSRKEEQDEKDYVSNLSIWRRVRAYWAVHGPEFLFIALVVGMQLAFGVWQLVKYVVIVEYREAFGWGVVLAKACAGALCPTFFFLILSMSRYFSTILRRSYHISRFINFDLSQEFHIKISCVALALSTLHAIGHLTGTFIYGTSPQSQAKVAILLGPAAANQPYSSYTSSLPGWSGMVALGLFWTLALCSMPVVRKWNYDIFQLSHLLMYPIIGLLMAHGTASLLQWPMLGYFLAFPTLLILVERVTRVVAGFQRIPATVRILDGETVEIKAEVPKERIWKYQAGKYVFLQVPQLSLWQWHPFTVSVCIGREFQLNIKTDGNWTRRLRDLAKASPDGKTAQIDIGINGPFGAPAQRFHDFSHTIVVGAGIGVTSFSGILADLQARNDRVHSCSPTDEKQRDRKPSLRNCHSDSSLASSASSSSHPDSHSPLPPPPASENKPNKKPNTSKLEKAPHNTTTPYAADYRRCDFHWMVRDRNYLYWFSDLLNRISRSQARYQRARRESRAPSTLDIRINTHVTQRRDALAVHVYRWLLEKQRRPAHGRHHRPSVSPLTGLVSPTHFGRPDFVAILDEHYEDMRRYRMSLVAREREEEEDVEGRRRGGGGGGAGAGAEPGCCIAGRSGNRLRVGVFFCGAPVVGEILADRCSALTARGRADGSRVEYYFITEVFGNSFCRSEIAVFLFAKWQFSRSSYTKGADMQHAKSGSVEDVEKIETTTPLPDDLPLPECLAHLNSDELRQLEKSLVRRLDCTLLPVVLLLFLLNIIDRNNIASAKIVGITETLNLTNNQYNTCLLLFYVGYVITQVPSNLIIGKVRPSLYICSITSAWGVISMCQGFTKNFAGLAVTRTILGLVEAPFLPGVFVLMSCWYKRSELPVRIAILYGGNMLATAFSGLIAAGITSRMDGKAGRPSWEWLFIIEGAMTTVIALLVIPLLPDYPLQSPHRWLSPPHQSLAEHRIRAENAGIPDTDPSSALWGLQQALLDPKLYAFTLQQMSLITAQSFNNFFPSIVSTLGYPPTTTLLLTAPPYLLAFLASLLVSLHASRRSERGLHIAACLAVALLGNLLAMLAPGVPARYAATFLMTAGAYAPYNLCVAWLSASLPRPRAKRGAALAVVNFMGAGVAHFYTSYMFPDSQKPRYYAGGGVMSGACVVAAAVAAGIKWHLRRENERFEREEREGGPEGLAAVGRKRGIVGAREGEGSGAQAVVRFRYVH